MSDRYPLEGWVSLMSERHSFDRERQCCACGFGYWSPTHVAIMSYREAVERAGRA